MTESGFMKGHSHNLPKIDVVMMTSFLSTYNEYISTGIEGMKASGSKEESYGDSSVGYVQVKRDKNICTVKARITPNPACLKGSNVTLTCDEAEGNILFIECEDCVTHAGGCKHCIAFLAWLHRRSEDPPSDNAVCYWKKTDVTPKGSSLKFIMAKDMCVPGQRQKPPPKSSPVVLNAFVEHCKKIGSMDCLLMKYFSLPSNIEQLSIHQFVCNIPRKPKSAREFIQFCMLTMDIEVCEEAGHATVDQNSCPLWHELKYARIPASKAHKAANCKYLDEDSLVDSILGVSVKDSKAIRSARLFKMKVIRAVEVIKKTKINLCGIILNPSCPIMAVSPDGETEIYTIKIKDSLNKLIDNIIKDNELAPKYMAEVQLQMHFSNKTKALFCVADSDFKDSINVDIVEVNYDKQYCENLINECTTFWSNSVYPFLFQ